MLSGRGLCDGPTIRLEQCFSGINYTGPREVLLEVVIIVF